MFVWRDENGKIIGAFANMQPGWAEEWLERDDPELIEFYESLAHRVQG